MARQTEMPPLNLHGPVQLAQPLAVEVLAAPQLLQPLQQASWARAVVEAGWRRPAARADASKDFGEENVGGLFRQLFEVGVALVPQLVRAP